MISKYQTESPRKGVPLRPDWASYAPPPFVARAMLCAARHAFDPSRYDGIESVARATWPDDRATLAILQRAATAPHSSSNAAALVVEAVGTFLANLAPISAAASLFAQAPRVSLGQFSTVRIPGRADPFAVGDAVWIAEGDPSPVVRLDLATVATLGPLRKMLSIVAASRELVEASDAESILDLMLRESASFSLDASVFTTIGASDARPAGLLNGISALTPSAATDKTQAMHDDLAALAGAVAAKASGLAFIMNSKQAAAVRLRYGATWPADVPVWPTIAAAAGVVIALDPAAVVSAFGADVETRASRETTMHMEDTAPLPIGSGTTVAKSSFSMWQVDSVSLKLVLRAAWTLRAPAIAWMSGVAW